jgi:transposase
MRKRIWRCPEPACARRTWTEVQPYATPRAKLTARATSWAVDALRHDDTTVSAIARHLGVAWDTCWSAIKADAQTRIAEPDRLKGIKTIGVDEHIWRPSKITSTDKAVTVMVDLTRDEHGCLQARLLDAVQGRSGKVYADWLTEHGVDVKVTVEHAALDPFRGYANAIRDELPDAVAVLDAFHVVKLAGQALDEVRRRVQQQTLHRRGHKDDPLYKVRRTLLTGDEHLTDRQRERLGRTPRRLSVNCTQADMQDMLTHSAGREPPHRFRCPPQQHRRRRSRNMKHDREQQQTDICIDPEPAFPNCSCYPRG